MPPLTGSTLAVAKYLQTMLEGASETLGIADVYYGDQPRIAHNPTVCVESGEKTNILNGVPRRVETDFRVYILVYHCPIQDTQVTRAENDALDEAIEDLIHTDVKLGGLIIDGMVTSIEPGYQAKVGSVYRASRLTFEGKSQRQLPYPTP